MIKLIESGNDIGRKIMGRKANTKMCMMTIGDCFFQKNSS